MRDRMGDGKKEREKKLMRLGNIEPGRRWVPGKIEEEEEEGTERWHIKLVSAERVQHRAGPATAKSPSHVPFPRMDGARERSRIHGGEPRPSNVSRWHLARQRALWPPEAYERFVRLLLCLSVSCTEGKELLLEMLITLLHLFSFIFLLQFSVLQRHFYMCSCDNPSGRSR